MRIRWMIATTMTVATIVATLAAATGRDAADESKNIAAALDSFHLAASEADGERYFAAFAPNGVFLGTDASERWNVEAFKTYAKPYFDRGQGWTYTAIEGQRFISIADDRRLAWFDELLNNEKYGTCRGSGILQKVGDEWKIVQYNLSFMVPNEVAKEVVALIKSKR